MQTSASLDGDAEGLVYVVDDEETVTRGLSRLFRSVGFTSETFRSAEAFLQHDIPDKPACLVLDLYLGSGQSGLELQARLAHHKYRIPIIFISGTGNVPATAQALKRGAVDFLEKPLDLDALLTSVRTALERSRDSLRAHAEHTKILSRYELLTGRERQVMWELLRAGSTNRALAEQLGASEKTIKAHRGRVMRKMQAKSVVDLLRMATLLGDAVRDRLGEQVAYRRRRRVPVSEERASPRRWR